jgi:dTMP kinase
MLKKHPLVVIEGMDGSGKMTQARLLVETLKTDGFAATYFDFPHYENVTGKAILGHLKQTWGAAYTKGDGIGAQLDELVFQCLMTVNRYEEAATVEGLLQKGPVVLDRYWPSGWVYGRANGLPDSFLRAIHAQLSQPNFCLFIDIPVEESFKRRPERRDRYETQKGMLGRVRELYLQLFSEMGWKVVDGIGTVAEVHARIREAFPVSFFLRKS